MTKGGDALAKDNGSINPLETIMGDQWASLYRWERPCSPVNSAIP
jgi:hypothetical protein